MRVVVFVLTCFILSSAAFAQDAATRTNKVPFLWVGAYADFNRNIFSPNFSSFPNVFRCDSSYLFQNGTGSGVSLGALVEYPLLSFMTVEARVGYCSLGGRLSRVVPIGNKAITGSTSGTIDKAESEHELVASLSAISVEPLLNFLLFGKVRASVGLRSAFLVSSTYTEQETLLSPSYAYFIEDSTRVRNQSSGLIPNVNSMQLAAVVGLGFDLPVGKRATLTPEARYNMALSKISDVDWSVSTIQFGASFRYVLYKAPPPMLINDTLYERDTTHQTDIRFSENRIYLKDSSSSVEQKSNFADDQEYVHRTRTIQLHYVHEQPKLAELDLKIQTMAQGSDGKSIALSSFVIEETELEENYPLLPHVFFPEGSAELNQTKMKQLSAQDAAAFSEFRMEGRSTLDVYYHLLNIVGSRMQMKNSAKLTLVGCNNGINAEKSNKELSQKRAESVKDYLVNIWHIDPSRIAIRSQNLPNSPSNLNTTEGQEENRRVELVSNEFEILRPVSIKDLTVKSSHTPVEIIPTVTSEAGVKNWKATISQDGTVLRSAKGESTPESVVWKPAEEPYPKNDHPVSVKYSVTDKSGQTIDAESRLQVQQLSVRKKRVEQKDDKRIDRFSLIVFDFNKADLNADNKSIVQDVKARIHENSTITIAGYADRSGEAEYNRELARRRCLEVQKSVGLNDKNSTIQPVGSDTLLFDNSTPEGRSYCRTVQIVIETPVN